jgi:hypothetical protein
MNRVQLIEPTQKSPLVSKKNEESFNMKELEETDRKKHALWLLDQPETWQRHIDSFQKRRHRILTRKGMRGITADELDEIDDIEEKIKECEAILRSLQ